MRIITDLTEANALLQSYTGCKLKIWLFDITHQKMALKLTLASTSEIVYIIGLACVSINGRFSVPNANLLITEEIDKSMNEMVIKITDQSSGFELVAIGGFAVAQGEETEFGTSFDNFFKDH